jgi:hypothetical protein
LLEYSAKKVLLYLQGTKNYMLTFKKWDRLKVISYSDSDFFGCVDSKKFTSGYIFMLVGDQFHVKMLSSL